MGKHGSVKQETHLVTSPRPASQAPIIGFSALLQLVEWCHVRRQKGQQGGPSCVVPEQPLSPPAPDRSSPSPNSAPVLVDVDRRIPRANLGRPQSRRVQRAGKSEEVAGSPRAVARPGFPQIRACPIKAPGSSCHVFATDGTRSGSLSPAEAGNAPTRDRIEPKADRKSVV